VKISILIEDFEHESPKGFSALLGDLDFISSYFLYDDSYHVEAVNVIKRSRSVEVSHYEKKKKKKV